MIEYANDIGITMDAQDAIDLFHYINNGEYIDWLKLRPDPRKGHGYSVSISPPECLRTIKARTA